jgi:hypothetical protein
MRNPILRHGPLLIAAVALALGVVACGVVGDGKVDRVDPPFGLGDTLAPTTTEAPTTTALSTTTTSGLETSTTGVQTEQVRLYYILSSQLTYVTQAVPTPATPQLIIAALQAGPQGELATAMRSAVPPPPTEILVSSAAGVATVQLPVGFFDNIAVTDQRLVTGQLVLTLTDSRGIGQVQFNQTVPKPSGEAVPAGQLLTRNDFVALLDSATSVDPANVPTTSTTVVTP